MTLGPVSSVNPPEWARVLLEWIQPRETEESVSGDLLEEFRHRAAETGGERRAAAWYVRQAVGFLWRMAWIFVVLTAGAVILRTLFDAFDPPSPGPGAYQFRSSLTTYAAIATYVTAGLYGALRTGKISVGLLVALTSHGVGHLISIAFAAGLYFFVLTRDVRALTEFEMSGGWGEAWGIPLMLLPIVGVLALAGGTLGKYMRGFSRQRLAG